MPMEISFFAVGCLLEDVVVAAHLLIGLYVDVEQIMFEAVLTGFGLYASS